MTQVVTNVKVHTGTAENPFIGLRNYTESDKEDFFGRDKEVKEVLRKLKTTRFLSIVGASGSGKTSLVQAGIIPNLVAGFEGQGGTKWGVAMFKPGRDPIGNLADALSKQNVLSPDIKAEPNSNKIEETLRRSSLGIVNCVKERSETLKGKNIIIVINQFEELFDLMDDDNMRNEARDFVKLLLRAVNENDRPIYVLITIESGALSEITKFRGLPEVVNQGQYLMPRMTKQDLRKVIMFPLERQNIRMDEALRGVILDNVEYTDDQLPILQHALMRTVTKWEIAKAESIANNLEIEDIERKHYNQIGEFSDDFLVSYEKDVLQYEQDIPEQMGSNIFQIREQLLKKFAKREDAELYVDKLLDIYQTKLEIEHYEALKPMESALGIHAEEVFRTFNSEQKKVCERIFKAITDGSKGVDNVKTQPVTIRNLAEIALVKDTDEIKTLLDELMKNGRNFVQISDRDMRGSTTVTLTHGSLVRKWNRLKKWVDEETESAKTYIRLANDAVIHEMDDKKQGLWRDNQLEFGEEWYHRTNPNSAWANRYHASYNTAIRFLEMSIAQRDAELAAKLKAEEDDKRRKRMILLIVSVAAAICLCLAAWAIVKQQEAAKSAEIAFRKEGEAKLSEYEANNEKVKAGIAAREASRQATIAKEKETEAQEASRLAAIAATKAAAEAKRAALEAKRAEKSAIEAGIEKKNAEGAKIEAEKAQVIAVQKAKEAAIAEAIAQKLKLQSLAEAIAIKSKRIENKPQIQGQVAKKAVEIFQKSDSENPIVENEILNPAIYEGVYFGIKAIKKSQGEKTFNEFIANDKHRGTVHAIVKGDNAFYTAGSDGKILKWDVTASKAVDKPKVVVSAIGERPETVLSMAVSGNTLVTGGKDRRLAIYTLGSSNPPVEADVHNGLFVWNVAFAGTKNDKIVSTGQDKKVYLTDLSIAKNGGKSTLLLNSPTDIKVLDVHINGRNVVLGATNGRISIIDINSPNKEVYSKVINAGISAIKYSPNGRYIVVADVYGKVHIYDADLNPIGDYEAHNLEVTDIEFNGNTGFVTTSRDKTAKYWLLSKLKEKNYTPFTFNDHSDWCTAANFTGNQAVVGCKDGSLKFWALDIGTLSNELCALLEDKNINRKDWNKYIGEDEALEATVGTSTCQ